MFGWCKTETTEAVYEMFDWRKTETTEVVYETFGWRRTETTEVVYELFSSRKTERTEVVYEMFGCLKTERTDVIYELIFGWRKTERTDIVYELMFGSLWLNGFLWKDRFMELCNMHNSFFLLYINFNKTKQNNLNEITIAGCRTCIRVLETSILQTSSCLEFGDAVFSMVITITVSWLLSAYVKDQTTASPPPSNNNNNNKTKKRPVLACCRIVAVS